MGGTKAPHNYPTNYKLFFDEDLNLFLSFTIQLHDDNNKTAGFHLQPHPDHANKVVIHGIKKGTSAWNETKGISIHGWYVRLIDNIQIQSPMQFQSALETMRKKHNNYGAQIRITLKQPEESQLEEDSRDPPGHSFATEEQPAPTRDPSGTSCRQMAFDDIDIDYTQQVSWTPMSTVVQQLETTTAPNFLNQESQLKWHTKNESGSKKNSDHSPTHRVKNSGSKKNSDHSPTYRVKKNDSMKQDF